MKRHLISLAVLCMLLGAACKNDSDTTADRTATTAENIPANISYELINSFPHDTLAFTEGLQFVNGKLYESVGNYGTSDVRITDLTTGKTERRTPMEEKYFGEGLTVMNGKVYQLSYQEKTGFIYDAKTLRLERTFSFNSKEGWGLTNDGKNLIMSDGGSNLYYLDPSTLREVNRVGVTDQYGAVPNINELEYIKGFIYANQWLNDVILKIDPANGRVVGKADLSTLRARTGIPETNKITGEGPDVLNGIAYDSASNKIYITGKYWPKLFEIKLDN